MENIDLEKLVELTNQLDEEGHTEEAAALDTLLIKFAQESPVGGEKEMSKKAVNALNTLHKACSSFCSKSLDSRGGSRRKLNSVCDMAEDLRDACEELL